MEIINGITAFYAADRAAWRQWLTQNHDTQTEVCLILYNKNSSTPTLPYPEAVEEALCFGWIDSVTRKRDAESRYQRFSPRKASSNWSASNVARVEKLIAAGLMQAAGYKMVELAWQKGKWPEPA